MLLLLLLTIIYRLRTVPPKVFSVEGLCMLWEDFLHKILHALSIGEISISAITRYHIKTPGILKILVLVNLSVEQQCYILQH